MPDGVYYIVGESTSWIKKKLPMIRNAFPIPNKATIIFSLAQVAFVSAVTFLVSTHVVSSSCVSLMLVAKDEVTIVIVASGGSTTCNSILKDMACF